MALEEGVDISGEHEGIVPHTLLPCYLVLTSCRCQGCREQNREEEQGESDAKS